MATSLLLADDSPTIAKILGMALQTEDYQIRSVLTADEAIHELKTNPPFFFLVDLTLPGKSGFEFAEMIRADSRLNKMKIILLSSAFEPVDEEAVRACGADLVIAKPFDPSELRASLRQIKDAPPKFPSGAKVQGSLSGQTVTAPEGTRTSLTDTALNRAREVISGPAPEELLQGMQGDLDANSILAGLAENAPAPGGPSPAALGDLPPPPPGPGIELEISGNGSSAANLPDLSGGASNAEASEPVLDLSNAFTPAGGTASLEIPASPEELILSDEPPPFPAPKAPAPAASPAPADLSPNAEALAAFFSAEIDAQKASASANPEEFEASLSSIEWESNSPADLDAWSASTQTAPSAPSSAPTAPPPKAPPARAQPSAAPNNASSFLFDTGGSNFRFAEDYITRITKSFVGHPDEGLPTEHSPRPVFPQQSNDAPRAPAAPIGGNWNPADAQKMEQIVREEVQMAVREVVEKIAWEVIPELAENLIKKELEKVMKQLET